MPDGRSLEPQLNSPIHSLLSFQERHVRDLRERAARIGATNEGFYPRSMRIRLGHVFQQACTVALEEANSVQEFAAELPVPYRKPRKKDWTAASGHWHLDLACLLQDDTALALEFTLDVQNCDATTRRELARRKRATVRLLSQVWRPARDCTGIQFHTVSLKPVSRAAARSFGAISIEDLFRKLETRGLDIVLAAVRGYERKVACDLWNKGVMSAVPRLSN